MPAPTLADLQRRFFASIGARPGAGAEAFDAELVAVIEPSATLAPAERLGIYADMYYGRLRDCLREDFPQLAKLLGDRRWEALVRAYLAGEPSRHPSVRHVADRLPGFLAAHPPADVPASLVDLAELELARLDVFDAPDATPLTGADLAATVPEAWGELRFGLVPGFRVVRSAFPIHRIWAEEAAPEAPPEPTILRVWREGFAVFHAPMAANEAVALEQIAAGASFATVCEEFAAGRSLEEAVPEAVGRLGRWIEHGLLVAYDHRTL